MIPTLADVSTLLNVAQWINMKPSARWLELAKDQVPHLYEAGVHLVNSGEQLRLRAADAPTAFAALVKLATDASWPADNAN